MKKNILVLVSFIILVFGVLSLAPAVLAETSDGTTGQNQNSLWSGQDGMAEVGLSFNSSTSGDSELVSTIIKIINTALGFLALIAVVITMIAGYQWMTAGGNEETVKAAKTRLKNGLIGLIIILLAWIIVYTVLLQTTCYLSDTYAAKNNTCWNYGRR